jgi:ketosteroid isomerase-like protein
MKKLFLAAAALVMCATIGRGAESVETAVLARLAEMQAAAEALDPDALFRFVAADAQAPIAENGVLFLTRDEALESTRNGFRGVTAISYTFRRQQVSVLGADAALVVGEGTTSITLEDGRTLSIPFAQSVVFTLRDGEWIVLHAHRSSPSRTP